MRHLLDIDDLSVDDLNEIIRRCAPGAAGRPLEGAGAALVFEKPSARTRNSMEMAVVQLGGHPVTIRPDEIGIDGRESAEDVARTLGCYHAVIGARVFDHDVLTRMAAVSDVPVVNMLSDRAHPLQALADLLTMTNEFGGRAGLVVAYVGDANNVARSLVLGCLLAGHTVRVASPAGFGFSAEDLDAFTGIGGEILCTDDPVAAVTGADVVYTDVWTSMGQEDEATQRREAFAGYCVDQVLFDHAAVDAIFLHCLPAHRGEEVSGEVVDGPSSRVWQQARNRMHAARGALSWLVAP
jgi:ornithine carbamoyltransferase